MNYRVELDLLGEKQVPKSAYYGIQTVRAKENFPITGNLIDVDLIISMAMVKKASAVANMKVGKLDKKVAEAIIKAADKIIAGEFHDQFITDPIQGGAGTSINMNTNEVIANIALELLGEEKGLYTIVSPNDHVNMAQSTNDAFPTAMHIAALRKLSKLSITLKNLEKEFAIKEKEFGNIIKMGRTHLQDAVPILLGQEFGAYKNLIQRDIKRVQDCENELLCVNMGATAVGTGLNADPEYIDYVIKSLRDITGFNVKGVESLVDGTQNTDCYMYVSSVLKVCMMGMSKVCNDIRMMASGPRAGFSELFLPPRQPGSSIMPGKVNPVMAEVVNQVAFKVAGNDLTIAMACEAGQFELNVMEPVIAHCLLESISIVANVFNVFIEYLLKDLKPNIERMKSYVDNSVGIVTAINPHVGYKVASKVAKEALETGISVKEILLRDGILSKEELAIILDPKEMTSPGIAGASMLKKDRK